VYLKHKRDKLFQLYNLTHMVIQLIFIGFVDNFMVK
jgi:hypothetical protein